MTITWIFVMIIAALAGAGAIIYFHSVYRLQRWLAQMRKLSQASEADSLGIEWLVELIKEYKLFQEGAAHEPNTQALIEAKLYHSKIRYFGMFPVPVGNIVRLQSQFPSAAIITGLLGTFIGLTMALFSMQDMLMSLGSAADSTITLQTILASISAPFQGMSLAFVTSIAGIGAALFLTLLQNGFFNRGHSVIYLIEELSATVESFLDHQLASELNEAKPKDYLEKVFDRFVSKVQNSFESSVGEFGNKMVDFTSGLQEAMITVQAILTSQQKFSEAFSESASQLHEFGDHLEDNMSKLTEMRQFAEREAQQLKDALTSLSKALSQQTNKHDVIQKKFEQLLVRSDDTLKQTFQRAKETNSLFLKGMEEQLNRAHDRQESIENRMQTRQDDWYRRINENQETYHRSANDFAASVDQLEKSWFEAIERLKRDVFEQLSRERDQHRYRHRDDEAREFLRVIDRFAENVRHDAAQIQHDLKEIQQLIYRLGEASIPSQTITRAPIEYRNPIQPRARE